MQPVPEELVVAVDYLRRHYGVGSGVESPYDLDGEVPDGHQDLEIAVHELAHFRTCYEPEKKLTKNSSRDIGDFFNALQLSHMWDESDTLEFEAVTIECLVFEMLGIELDHDRLFDFASGPLLNHRLSDLIWFVISRVSDQKFLDAAERVVQDLYQAYEMTQC